MLFAPEGDIISISKAIDYTNILEKIIQYKGPSDLLLTRWHRNVRDS